MIIKLLNAVVATTVGDGYGLNGIRPHSVQFIAADISSGNGAFEIHGSNDGVNWTLIAFIDNLANTNGQTPTRVTSKTVSSNGGVFVFLDRYVKFEQIRAKVTRTTDGTYSAVLHCEPIR